MWNVLIIQSFGKVVFCMLQPPVVVFTQVKLCLVETVLFLCLALQWPTLLPLAAFSLDTEQPDYDLDSEDETFVNKLKKKMEITALQFEEMIDRLEKGSGQQVLFSLCASSLDCMVVAKTHYWLCFTRNTWTQGFTLCLTLYWINPGSLRLSLKTLVSLIVTES